MTMRKGLPAKLALTDADDTRYLFSGLVVCNTDGTPRGGVLSPVGENLVTATGTMNVSVKRFQGAAVRDAGVVLLANDGPTNVLLDAAPASNKRLDVVWAKQNDASGTVSVPDANNLPVLGVAKGTAGAVPVKSSIPDGALELATVEVPSTATATNSVGVVITQTAPFTAGAGGVVSFRTKTALELWVTATKGQRAYVLADGGQYVSDGVGVWKSAGFPHAEFTTTVSLGNGTGGTMGALTADLSRSENGGFVTSPSAGTIRLQPGLYSITETCSIPADTTGLTLLGLVNGANIVGRSSFPNSSSAGLTFTYPNYLVTAANTDLTLYLYQTTGGTRTVTGRVAVTKLA